MKNEDLQAILPASPFRFNKDHRLVFILGLFTNKESYRVSSYTKKVIKEYRAQLIKNTVFAGKKNDIDKFREKYSWCQLKLEYNKELMFTKPYYFFISMLKQNSNNQLDRNLLFFYDLWHRVMKKFNKTNQLALLTHPDKQRECRPILEFLKEYFVDKSEQCEVSACDILKLHHISYFHNLYEGEKWNAPLEIENKWGKEKPLSEVEYKKGINLQYEYEVKQAQDKRKAAIAKLGGNNVMNNFFS